MKSPTTGHHASSSPAGIALLLASLSALGPFSIDAYLPSFHDIGSSLHASPVAVQQTLTAYLLPYAGMSLWHGALSDSFGRRKVMLGMLILFLLGSVGCLCAWSIESLTFFRVIQGISAGAGTIIGRAMVRDLFDGIAARQLMSRIAVVFALAPALGPIMGGWLQVWWGWRSVFVMLSLMSLLLIIISWRVLPETLKGSERQPLHFLNLAKSYGRALISGRYLLLVMAVTLNFSAVFLYIVSAPAFVQNLLHRSETEFYWLFIPITLGMISGTWLSGKVAAIWSNSKTITIAYIIMLVAAAVNFLMHRHHGAMLLWSILPLAAFVVGNSLAMPSLTLMALDLFPERRGLAASCQGFVQTSGNALVNAVLAPLLWHSASSLALGMLGIFGGGLLAFTGYQSVQRLTGQQEKMRQVDA
jgi:MFS transporter, DHA1 family, multidrug resistance protein